MNVHPDCQIDAGKCTPKSRLLRRQKSASELDSRVLPGTEDDSKYFFISLKYIIVVMDWVQKTWFAGFGYTETGLQIFF